MPARVHACKRLVVGLSLKLAPNLCANLSMSTAGTPASAQNHTLQQLPVDHGRTQSKHMSLPLCHKMEVYSQDCRSLVASPS